MILEKVLQIESHQITKVYFSLVKIEGKPYPALLVKDDMVQTYLITINTNPISLVELIRHSYRDGNAIFRAIMMNAYERQSTIVFEKKEYIWSEYQKGLDEAPFYQPLPEPAKLIDIPIIIDVENIREETHNAGSNPSNTKHEDQTGNR